MIIRKLTIFIIICIGLSSLTSCGMGKKLKDFHKPVDLRKEPLDPDERARRNIEQGRGIGLGNIGRSGKTTLNSVHQSVSFIGSS